MQYGSLVALYSCAESSLATMECLERSRPEVVNNNKVARVMLMWMWAVLNWLHITSSAGFL
jgi:hypothetical protein